MRDSYRDEEGFGRPVEVEPRVMSVVGPDDLDHASGCEFILTRGILPCSCDATRRRFSDRDPSQPKGWWWKCWFRWQEVRVRNQPRNSGPLPWPVRGPDGDPWVPGIDFNDGRSGDDI